MAPDSKTRIGFGPLRSISAGIFEFGIDRDEAAAELVAVADPDQPGVIFGAGVAERQQLLQHHRDLHAVRRAERIELQRMAADRQLLVVRGPGDGAVDVGEAAAVGLVPGPDFRRHILVRRGHSLAPGGSAGKQADPVRLPADLASQRKRLRGEGEVLITFMSRQPCVGRADPHFPDRSGITR